MLTMWHPLSVKVGTNITVKRWLLRGYSLLVDSSNEFICLCVHACMCLYIYEWVLRHVSADIWPKKKKASEENERGEGRSTSM
jgi:hypothetical protein